MTYSDKPWTKHYDEGVSISLEPYPDHPLYEYLDQSAKNHPD